MMTRPGFYVLCLAFVASLPCVGQDGATLQRGKAVFDHVCEPCHGMGAAKAGTTVLEYRYKGSKPALLDQRTDLTPDIVRGFVRNGVGLMAKFRKTEVTDGELNALGAYIARKDKTKP